jgi:hypothetical protein
MRIELLYVAMISTLMIVGDNGRTPALPGLKSSDSIYVSEEYIKNSSISPLNL